MGSSLRSSCGFASRITSVFGVLSALTGALLASQASYAASFGVFEPRGQAMGGVGVASAKPEHSAFYNPALMGFNDGHERDTDHGRFIFPVTALLVTENITDIIDVLDDDLPGLDDEVSAALDLFNSDPVAGEAGLLSSIDSIDNIFDELGNETIVIDNFFGGVVSEPSDREGGTFYFGVRAIARGITENTSEDQELLDNYRETIEFLAGGNDSDLAPFPELIDAGGSLVDPEGQIMSTADVSSLLITEAGLSVGKEFELFGHYVSFGINPKAMYVKAYRQSFFFGEENIDIDYQGIVEGFFTLNADLGIAYELDDYWTFGLTVKDLVRKQFVLENNVEVLLAPKVRMGTAYNWHSMVFAFDLDLIETKPLGSEPASQEFALGWEWELNNAWALRAGYQKDILSELDGITSAGVGVRWGRVVGDFSFSLGGDIIGAGGQIGIAF